LILHTGLKTEIPFEVLIVFSTNLESSDLVDEAFLRRIHHKIDLGDPPCDNYREIPMRECADRNIPFNEEGLTYLLRQC
jgi:hypothetical protein